MDENIMEFQEFEKENQISHEKIEPLLSNDGLIIIPKEKDGHYMISDDTTILIKELKSKGINVQILKDKDKPIDMYEHRSADVVISLGVIVGTAVITTIINFLGQYIYDKYFNSKEKSNPTIRLEYYDFNEGKLMRMEAPAEEFKKLK